MDEDQRIRLIRRVARALEPVENELNALGYSVLNFDDVVRSGRGYPEAIPILLAWLPRLPEVAKESVVRALSVPWAKPMAAPLLIEEFKNVSNDSLRWSIGNALDIVADQSVLDDLIELALDRRFGRARQMVVMALGKFNVASSEGAALQLLDDSEVEGHAVYALRRLRSLKALPLLEMRKNHPQAWIRAEVKKALRVISAKQARLERSASSDRHNP